jgi:phosphoribosylformylglycinamidine synthase subunit PurSL
LAQLVRMCQALYDSATFFGIPMTSGKDSMKNDLRRDGVTISVPPTVLYSMVAGIDDVRRTVTSEFKAAGDLVYLVGATYDELGGSELYALSGHVGSAVPVVRRDDALRIYRRVMEVQANQLLESCHDCSDGGLAVALTEATFGRAVGIDVDLGSCLPATVDEQRRAMVALFSESHSRFVVSVQPERQAAFERVLARDACLLGRVTDNERVLMRQGSRVLVDCPRDQLLSAWQHGLERARGVR